MISLRMRRSHPRAALPQLRLRRRNGVLVGAALAVCTCPVLVSGEAVNLTWTFRCSDDLRVERTGQTAVRLQSAVLVSLATRDGRMTVEVRGDQPVGAGVTSYTVQAGDSLTLVAERQLGSRDRWRDIANATPGLKVAEPLKAGQQLNIPAAGEAAQATLTLGAAAPVVFPMPSLRYVIDQREGRRAPAEDSGLPQAWAEELAGMLCQGPAVNVLRSAAEQTYAVRLQGAPAEYSLRGVQRNEKLWADLSLSGLGEAEIGGREWQLPMIFDLPRQDLAPGLTLSGTAKLLYASIRPGAEGEVTATVTVQTAAATIQRTWSATPVLRDLPALAAPTTLPATQTLGPAGTWTRLGALGLLGVQRLPGISEAGLALWSTAAAADAAIAARVADPALVASVAGLPAIAAPPPAQVPRAELERISAERDAVIGERDQLRARDNGLWLVELDAAAVGAQASATTGGGGQEPSGVQFIPTLDGRIGFGDRLRWGLGAFALRMSVSSTDSALTWGEGGGGAWVGWRGDNWNISALGGLALDSYVVRSPNYATSTATMSPAVALSGEWVFAETWSTALRLHLATGGGSQQVAILPSLRWWVRPSLAFQAQVGSIQLSNTMDGGQTVSGSAIGVGVGVVLRR